MKKLYYLTLFLLLFTGVSFSQIQINESTNPGLISSSYAFLDGSQSGGYDAYNSAGKGIIFPRTDLTLVEVGGNNPYNQLYDLNGGGLVGSKTYYDGLVVFNTGKGPIPASGMGSSTADVSPGFYYYRNTGNSWNSGVWTPMGGEGSSPKIYITENTPTETNLVTLDTTVEKVISITGTADGITTHIDLGTTVLPKDTVINFRKAIICDNTGNQVLVATGSYDSATNKFVTGNGMMNYLLPAANDYKVELYYTSN
jgi:hypothetical protein